MADLTGSFSSIHFAALAQLLADLGKSGDLLISDQHWVGQLSLQDGHIVAARIEDERGLSALELILSGAAATASFEFFDGSATLAPEIDRRWDFVDGIQRFGASPLLGWMARLRSPASVPRLAVNSELPEELEITLTRASVRLFLDIDGQRTIQELVKRHGLRCCVTTLQSLCDLGLAEIRLDAAGAPGAGGDATVRAPSTLPSTPGAAPPSTSATTPFQPEASASVAARLGRFARLNRSRGLEVGGELLQAVVLAGVLVLAGRIAVENFRVEGISMQPNFASGQVLVVNRLAYLHIEGAPLAHLLPTTAQGSIDYLFGGPQRGDIAIFLSPVEPGVDYIKRVIGLPGDKVAVHDGHVYVNGELLTEAYIEFPADYRFPLKGDSMTVPQDSYFVLGDNRPESLDSHFGWFVPVENLVGRAWLRYWPLGEVSVLQPGTSSGGTVLAASASAQP
jgi:signal peptidase I